MRIKSKQPIKIEKPFQSLLTFSHSAGEKKVLQSVLLSFFSVFIFSMPSKVSLAARAKMSLSRAQNIFMPANINSIFILAQSFHFLEVVGRKRRFEFEGLFKT